MKRLQIMIEEEVDAALAKLAAERDTSKAALIREFVRERIETLPPRSSDPLFGLVGADPLVEPGDIDAVVYG